MRRLSRSLRVVAATAVTATSVLILQPGLAQAEVPPPTLTLLVGGQPIRDTSVLESGTTLTAVASSLLQEGNGPRELRLDLDPATIYQSGGVTAPEGWTVEWSIDGGDSWVGVEPNPASGVTNVRATASVEAGAAALGSQRYTKQLAANVPASSFSGSTGGDGWDVFFYDDYVLNMFHHQGSAIPLDCHLRSTGERCPGFNPTVNASPGVTGSRFPGYQTADRSGGWVNGDTGRAYLFTVESATNRPGVFCVDLNVAPPVACGFTALSADTNVPNYQRLSNAEGAGGRVFGIETTNQKLLCFDPATGAACADSPIQLSGSTDTAYYHVYPLGSKVFATSNVAMYCFESATLSPCAGSWPVTNDSLGWTPQRISPVAHMDADGTIDGVCMWNGCLDLAGADRAGDWVNPHSITAWANDPGHNWYSGQYGRFEATAGRAYLLWVLTPTKNPDIYCFDYATEAACDGFAEQVNDIYLYALRADPNNPTCIWYNSDPGKIGLFDAYTGATECTANPVITLQPSAFAPRFVCQSAGGIDRWVSVELTALSGADPVSTQQLTMRTGNGDVVPGWGNLPIGVGQALDMSSLNVAATGARPTFNVGFALTSGSLTGAEFEVVYEGRGPELCVDLTIDNTAADGSPNCPAIVALTSQISEDVAGPTTATAADRSIVASGAADECPPLVVPATRPEPPVDLTASSNGSAGSMQFKAPVDDGGSPIRWYEYSIGSGPWQVAPAMPDGDGGFVVPLNGLGVGDHEVAVRAVNLIGTSDEAVYSFSVLPPTESTTTTTTTTTPSTTIAPTTSLAPATTTMGTTLVTPTTAAPTTVAPTIAPMAPTFVEPTVPMEPSGMLPATGGGGSHAVIVWATLLMAAGFAVMAASRRRRPV